jgi:hypothetical protein
MHFLPKANPLYEQISADKVILPDILEKLAKGHFTGYLSHIAAGFEAYCIFAKGKLICVICTEGERDRTGFEAVTLLFDKAISIGGEINVYRMTTDLAMCAHALVLGMKLLQSEEVRKVDMKSLLARIKNQDMNGVVRFFTDDRSAMMFYKNGQPFGFYHDRIKNIETSPDEARKVAALPGARVEVLTTRSIEELMISDLLQMVNLHKMWDAANYRRSKPVAKAPSAAKGAPTAAADAPAVAAKEPIADAGKPAVAANEIPQQSQAPVERTDEKLNELVEDLKEVAMAYLSREGRILIEKRVSEAGGNRVLLDDDKTEAMIQQIEDEARVIDSHARIDEMVDLMRSEIAGRLAVL